MWSTVRVGLETTGDNGGTYLMMARHLGSVSPGADLTANGSLIYVMTGPGGKDIGTTAAPKFTVAQTAGTGGTITFTVPASVIKKPKSVRVTILADLSDGGYTRYFTMDRFPNNGWSPWVSSSKAAATATKVKPTISLNTTSVKKGKAAKLTIAVKQNAAGSATIYDGKTALKTVSFAKKTAEKTVTLPKNLAAGKHQITVEFVPKAKKFATGKSAKVTLTVR